MSVLVDGASEYVQGKQTTKKQCWVFSTATGQPSHHQSKCKLLLSTTLCKQCLAKLALGLLFLQKYGRNLRQLVFPDFVTSSPSDLQ